GHQFPGSPLRAGQRQAAPRRPRAVPRPPRRRTRQRGRQPAGQQRRAVTPRPAPRTEHGNARARPLPTRSRRAGGNRTETASNAPWDYLFPRVFRNAIPPPPPSPVSFAPARGIDPSKTASRTATPSAPLISASAPLWNSTAPPFAVAPE